MSRRGLILKELGLSPVWVRRQQPNVGVKVAADESGATEAVAVPGQQAAAATDMPGIADAASAGDRVAQIQAMDWAQLRSSTSLCTACVLHQARKQAVLGVGDVKAQWLFVGEAPGAEEDERGEPFVGQAGKLLDNMLAAIGLKRGENVYIANVVKCRPPENRTPGPAEGQACEPYLLRQIELIGPHIIVALGKVAAQSLLGKEVTLASLRGRVHRFRGIPLIVTYHPAYLLRTLNDKSKAWEDLCLAIETMRALKPEQAAPS